MLSTLRNDHLVEELSLDNRHIKAQESFDVEGLLPTTLPPQVEYAG